MISLKVLNLIGLGADIAGALIMFINTPHPRNEPTGPMSDLKASSNWLFYVRYREQREVRWNKVGIFLLCSGFVLQAIAALVN